MAHLGEGTGEAATSTPWSRPSLLDALVTRRRAVLEERQHSSTRPEKTASTEAGSDVDLDVTATTPACARCRPRCTSTPPTPAGSGASA